jgi:hypothetical protein
MSFEERIEKAAKILDTKPEILRKHLEPSGIDGIELLDASTTSHGDLQGIVQTKDDYRNTPILKLKAAVGILKGGDPFVTDVNSVNKTLKSETSLEDLIKSSIPLDQRSDEDILNAYIETQSDPLETELQRRAKGQRFVVLKEGNIDVESTLYMLKKSRKNEIPPMKVNPDKSVTRFYKIEEVHENNRVRYESPLRPGVILLDGFCQVSNQNYVNVDDNARKMLRLIRNDLGEQSRMDETRLVEVAEKEGIQGLGRIFPEIHENYLKLSLVEQLPSLKVIAPVETRQADPFYQNKNKKVW